MVKDLCALQATEGGSDVLKCGTLLGDGALDDWCSPSSSKHVVRDKEYYILLLLPFSTGHGTKPLGATELACWGILPTIFTLQQVCLLVKL